MIISIHQPAYLPWLGHFHRLAMSDLHIVLDHVQYEKNSFINRNKIRTSQGWSWLTVPVQSKGRFGELPINVLKFANNSNWPQKHWQTIRQNYAKTMFFGEHVGFFEHIYTRNWSGVAELLEETTTYLRAALGIRTEILYSARMKIGSRKEQLVLNLCREVGATTYLSGPLGKNYLDAENFARHGITVVFHEYQHPEYRQAYEGFEPYMAVIDLLFNHGPRSMEILCAGQKEIC